MCYRILILSLFFSSSCALNPIAQRPNANELVLPSFEELLPDGPSNTDQLPHVDPNANSGSLLTTLSTLGIHLSNEEVSQLRKLTEIQPNGRWSRSQTQTPEQNLLANFRRFGPLFTPPLESAEEYRVQAISFAEKASVPYYLDLQYYLDAKRLLVIKWDETSGQFVVVQSDGSLVNYLITHAIQSPRYLKVEL